MRRTQNRFRLTRVVKNQTGFNTGSVFYVILIRATCTTSREQNSEWFYTIVLIAGEKDRESFFVMPTTWHGSVILLCAIISLVSPLALYVESVRKGSRPAVFRDANFHHWYGSSRDILFVGVPYSLLE